MAMHSEEIAVGAKAGSGFHLYLSFHVQFSQGKVEKMSAQVPCVLLKLFS